MNMNCELYIDGVLELHANGKIDAYEEYRKLYPKLDQETELQFIIRCAALDFNNDPIFFEKMYLGE